MYYIWKLPVYEYDETHVGESITELGNYTELNALISQIEMDEKAIPEQPFARRTRRCSTSAGKSKD